MPSFKDMIHLRVKKVQERERHLCLGMCQTTSPSEPHSHHSSAVAGQSPSPCSGNWLCAIGSGSGEFCTRSLGGVVVLFPNSSDRRMNAPLLEIGFQVIAKEGPFFVVIFFILYRINEAKPRQTQDLAMHWTHHHHHNGYFFSPAIRCVLQT